MLAVTVMSGLATWSRIELGRLEKLIDTQEERNRELVKTFEVGLQREARDLDVTLDTKIEGLQAIVDLFRNDEDARAAAHFEWVRRELDRIWSEIHQKHPPESGSSEGG